MNNEGMLPPEGVVRTGYEINDFAKEDAWRMFRIIGEMVGGFDRLSGIEPAVTIYGSARVKPEQPLYETTVQIAQELGKLGFAIITGGGPGLMEAANKGASLAGVTSAGLNIELPEEQQPNPYSNLTISFNHFFARKVMLAKYATAFIAMPGGIGTLDELTEIVCLIQTHNETFPGHTVRQCVLARAAALVAHHDAQWRVHFTEDLRLLVVCDTVEDVVKTVHEWYDKQELAVEPAMQSVGRTRGKSTRGAGHRHENGPK
jgi:uncharacterized protein (TIGR00730 family)